MVVNGLFGVSYEELARIPKMNKFACIINTDKETGEGIHWVAAVMENGVGWFYNSLGEKPTEFMARELQRIGSLTELFYWDTQQQPNESYKCGYYALQFVARFCRGIRGFDLYDGLGLKKSEMEANDKKIIREFKRPLQ
jgi:endo-beta-N-acetylglucosaminidase D